MAKLPDRIGATIRATREQAGLSREHLAYHAGVSTAMITRLENYDQLPKAVALARIVNELGLSLDDLLADQVAS